MGAERGCLPAAASPLTRHLVHGPVRGAQVLGRFPTAVYLAAGPGHADVLPLLASDALLLPTGMRLVCRSAGLAWQVRPGDVVAVGDGCVELPGLVAYAVREWRPARVGTPTAATEHRPLNGRRLVRSLLGAGVGLTPSGDDILCGALLALRAAGAHQAHAALAEAVLDGAGRTTSLSASLLRAAVDGYAVACVCALVTATVAGDDAGVTAALPEVLAIGHSSGRALVTGIGAAISLLPPALAEAS